MSTNTFGPIDWFAACCLSGWWPPKLVCFLIISQFWFSSSSERCGRFWSAVSWFGEQTAIGHFRSFKLELFQWKSHHPKFDPKNSVLAFQSSQSSKMKIGSHFKQITQDTSLSALQFDSFIRSIHLLTRFFLHLWSSLSQSSVRQVNEWWWVGSAYQVDVLLTKSSGLNVINLHRETEGATWQFR